MEKCPYKKKEYCLFRDDKCIPNSLKCKKNKRVFRNTEYLPVQFNRDVCKRQRAIIPKNNLYTCERYGYNKTVSTMHMDGIIVLYVFKGFLNLKRENTIDYYIYVNDIRTKETFKLLVAYNNKKHRYYISDTQIKRMHKLGLFPNIIIYACNDGTIPVITDDFHKFSKLALYGYSVGKID